MFSLLIGLLGTCQEQSLTEQFRTEWVTGESSRDNGPPIPGSSCYFGGVLRAGAISFHFLLQGAEMR